MTSMSLVRASNFTTRREKMLEVRTSKRPAFVFPDTALNTYLGVRDNRTLAYMRASTLRALIEQNIPKYRDS
jgi:hypothetical protein